jgi:uncharacterized protein (TIGR02001 family)
VRLLANGIVLALGLGVGTARCAEGDLWGGSLGIANDYMVRGISRSDDHAALQLDLHYVDASGFAAGMFTSNTKINPNAPSSAEIDVYVGFAWNRGADWQGKVLLSHYDYPWYKSRSGYSYDELGVLLSYREWLNIDLSYSPDAPLVSPYRGLIGVGSETAEVNLQHRVIGKLSATAGIGYSHFAGQEPRGYGYWSIGAAYELSPVSLVLSYVNTTASAKALFYNAAADNRWTGTVIWRF